MTTDPWRIVAWRKHAGAPWVPSSDAPMSIEDALELARDDLAGDRVRHEACGPVTYLTVRVP